MLSEILSSKDGIAIFPILSLLVTSGIFVWIIIWAYEMDKKVVMELEQLPFDGEGFPSQRGEDSHV
jgi:hypothetical protein